MPRVEGRPFDLSRVTVILHARVELPAVRNGTHWGRVTSASDMTALTESDRPNTGRDH
jgi:hypothetical protein